MKPELVVATVLKTGGEYGPEQVLALRDNVARRLRRPHRFVCLTDHAALSGPDYPPLKHGWRGWWSKIELFRPGALPEGLPVWYLDLDTLVTGSVDDIVLGHRFTVLRNFWDADRIGSGLMAWDPRRVDLSDLYEKFAAAPMRYMAEYITTEKWGDQGFIRWNGPTADRWQVLHPGRVVSFKLACLPVHRVPAGASVVCFHGQPRPWRLPRRQAGWFEEVAA